MKKKAATLLYICGRSTTLSLLRLVVRYSSMGIYYCILCRCHSIARSSLFSNNDELVNTHFDIKNNHKLVYWRYILRISVPGVIS